MQEEIVSNHSALQEYVQIKSMNNIYYWFMFMHIVFCPSKDVIKVIGKSTFFFVSYKVRLRKKMVHIVTGIHVNHVIRRFM